MNTFLILSKQCIFDYLITRNSCCIACSRAKVTPEKLIFADDVDHLEEELEALEERHLRLDEAGGEVGLHHPVHVEVELPGRLCGACAVERALHRLRMQALSLAWPHIALRFYVKQHEAAHSHQHVRRALYTIRE